MNFEAGVQYNDYKGTVAADRSDDAFFTDEFREKLGIAKDDAIVALRFSAYSYPERSDKLNMVVYTQAIGSEDIHPIEADVSPEEFFVLFKRFNFVMTRQGETPEGNVLGD